MTNRANVTDVTPDRTKRCVQQVAKLLRDLAVNRLGLVELGWGWAGLPHPLSSPPFRSPSMYCTLLSGVHHTSATC